MRIILLSIVLTIAAPSLAAAGNSPECEQGWTTKTCGNFTGCARPEWQCCPFQSSDGWQWSDPPCPSEE
ncbi:MAG: hypothetical protein L0Y57_06860 [Beijerinckiaceae bacterium]|nr:hypothetical protein [Beijerinckiaceae bacterium]